MVRRQEELSTAVQMLRVKTVDYQWGKPPKAMTRAARLDNISHDHVVVVFSSRKRSGKRTGRQQGNSRALAQTLIPLNIHLFIPLSAQFHFFLTKTTLVLQYRFRRWPQKPYPRVVVRRAKLLELTLPIKRQSLFLVTLE